jgi:hypothetical protein
MASPFPTCSSPWYAAAAASRRIALSAVRSPAHAWSVSLDVMAWSPLVRGMLTGKYRRDRPQPDALRAKFLPKAMSDAASLDATLRRRPLNCLLHA